MSNLNINNLEEVRDLDRAERTNVQGGLSLPLIGEIPMYGLTNVLASVNSATISQNATNIVMGGAGGDGDTGNYLGSVTLTNVNLGNVTNVQGGLPV